MVVSCFEDLFDVLCRFLLAKLHTGSLIGKTNLRAVRNALEHLPTGVNATYDEVMVRTQRQNEDDKTLAEHVLKWVTCACRSLTRKELQYVLAVAPDSEMTDVDLDALVDEVILVEVCAGLVVIDESRGIIRLVRKLFIHWLQDISWTHVWQTTLEY